MKHQKEEFLIQRCEDYLTWSLAYYEENISLASNNMYDTGCGVLKANYNKLPESFREVVSKDDLSAGTGFTLTLDKIPSEFREKVLYRLRNDEEWDHGE